MMGFVVEYVAGPMLHRMKTKRTGWSLSPLGNAPQCCTSGQTKSAGKGEVNEKSLN